VKENNIDKLKNYIETNNYKITQWNSKEFDILIYAIENVNSISMIKFLIKECNYSTLNYFIFKDYEYKSPLSAALANNNFKIADVLLDNKADINYRMNDSSIYQNLFYKKKLNKNNLLYILNKSKNLDWIQPKLPLLIDDCIYKRKSELIKFIFNYFIFDNSFILNLLQHYKEKVPLSKKQLKDQIVNEKNKIKISDNWYNLAFEKECYKIFNIFLENDSRDKSDILKPLLKAREYIDQLYNFNKLSLFIEKVRNGELKFGKSNPILDLMMTINDKRDKVMKIIKENKINKLEEFILVNSISLMDLNGHRFDVLIYSIECNASFEMIKFIIDHYTNSLYDYYIIGENDLIKTPLTVSLINNRFDITDLLIKEGANINYRMFQGVTSSIICYLYEHEFINKKNLRYLLNHSNLKKSYVMDFINMLSKKKPYISPDIFLEIVVKRYIFSEDFILRLLHFYRNRIPLNKQQLSEQVQKEKNKIPINDWWYKKALDKNNYNAFKILFDHDSREKDEILRKIFKLYDYYDKNDECEKSETFIKKLKDPQFKISLDSIYFDNMKNILEQKKSITHLIKNGNIEEFEKYLRTHKIILNQSNHRENYWRNEDGFDILIYAIENDASLDMIKYIISLYDNLNYSNKCYFNYKFDFDYFHEKNSNNDYNNYYIEEDADFRYYFRNSYKSPIRTPLYSAIINKKYEIIDFLIEKGVDINFRLNDSNDGDIIHLLHKFHQLNEENLTFVLRHGFNIKRIIDNIDQELKTKNSYLLNYLFIGVVFKEYLSQESKKEDQNKDVLIKDEWYKIAIDKCFYNLMEILLKYEPRDKTIVFDYLYGLFENDDDKNYSPGKQYIFINHIKNKDLKQQISQYFMNKVTNKPYYVRKHKLTTQFNESVSRKKKIRLS